MAGQGVDPEWSLDTQKVANCLFVDCMDNRTVHLFMKQSTKSFALRLLRARTSPQQPMPCHCTSNGPTTKPTFGNMLSKRFLPSEVVMDTFELCMDRKNRNQVDESAPSTRCNS